MVANQDQLLGPQHHRHHALGLGRLHQFIILHHYHHHHHLHHNYYHHHHYYNHHYYLPPHLHALVNEDAGELHPRQPGVSRPNARAADDVGQVEKLLPQHAVALLVADRQLARLVLEVNK